jgi:TetR/AcrR family transcriptional repressor of nem operon
LLKLGSELLLSRGYNGFSYQDLSERLSIRKASIHHHFPSKEDLGLVLLDMYRKGFDQVIGSKNDGASPFFQIRTRKQFYF